MNLIETVASETLVRGTTTTTRYRIMNAFIHPFLSYTIALTPRAQVETCKSLILIHTHIKHDVVKVR